MDGFCGKRYDSNGGALGHSGGRGAVTLVALCSPSDGRVLLHLGAEVCSPAILSRCGGGRAVASSRRVSGHSPLGSVSGNGHSCLVCRVDSVSFTRTLVLPGGRKAVGCAAHRLAHKAAIYRSGKRKIAHAFGPATVGGVTVGGLLGREGSLAGFLFRATSRSPPYFYYFPMLSCILLGATLTST